jgi:hypothetical protein
MYNNFLDQVIKNSHFKQFLNNELDELKINFDIDNINLYQHEVNSDKHITDFFIKILKKSNFLS